MSNDEQSPLGDSFESFLETEGIRDEVYSAALKQVRAWKLDRALLPEPESSGSSGPCLSG
jgi:antitoxin HicB